MVARLELDLAGYGGPARGPDGRPRIEVIADDADLAALDALGVPYEVLVPDLVAFYRSRLGPLPESPGPYGAWLVPPFAGGGMGGYYTFDEVVAVLDQMIAAYPNLISARTSLGKTVEGRDLWMVKISDNPNVDEPEPEVRIDALHHAREPASIHTTLWFMLYLLEEYGSDPLATYLVNERELWFVPVVNPDGYVYNQTISPGGGGLWRKNRSVNAGGSFGVDLNRNYPEKWGYDNVGSSPNPGSETYRGPAPASEPEVQAMSAFTAGRHFRTALTAHSYGNQWLYPYGYDQLVPTNVAEYEELGQLATEINGYELGPMWDVLYLVNGGVPDFDHEQHGIVSYLPEIGSSGDGFWPATARIVPLAEENLLAFQRTALAAGAFVHAEAIERAELGDGDGYLEPGETVEWRLSVRNSGRDASAGPVVARVASASPWVAPSAGQYSFGVLGPFSGASNAASPLALAIDPAAPLGTAVEYTLALAYEGWTQSFPGRFVIGEPRPFLADRGELDLGWTLGVPGDTATRGLWVQDDPIGTTAQNQLVNPEDDATPAPGVRCYVTGNGGGSANFDDVDGGATTLLSPVFDLSAAGPALLAYSRWFADLTVVDDEFRVFLSNDGGQAWTPLETVGTNQNAWKRVEFLVPEVLPQTDRMRLRFVASDEGQASLVEAAVDELEVSVFEKAPRLNVYGDSRGGGTVVFNVTGEPGGSFFVTYSTSPPGMGGGPVLHALRWGENLLGGTFGAGTLASLQATVPASPVLVGTTFWFQAMVSTPGGWVATNAVSLTVQ